MRPKAETLIKILSHWVIQQTGTIGTGQGGPFDVEDFMNASGILMDLKGVKAETWEIAPKEAARGKAD